jgi:hypothetical protein
MHRPGFGCANDSQLVDDDMSQCLDLIESRKPKANSAAASVGTL